MYTYYLDVVIADHSDVQFGRFPELFTTYILFFDSRESNSRLPYISNQRERLTHTPHPKRHYL